MVEEEYEEDEQIEEATQKQMDAQQEYSEELSPSVQERDSLFNVFWKIIKIKDSTKVANLDGREIGQLPYTVRDCQKIGALGEFLGHENFARYFYGLGEITLSTSSSKKGWLVDSMITQKKTTTKLRGESNLPQLQAPDSVQKKRRFGIF